MIDDKMYEICKDCPYCYREVNQCMYGEEGVPDDLEKKCEVKKEKMNKLESQNVEDINISFNKDINSYVINVSYRHTDKEGNVDIISIRDLPITINPYPDFSSNITCEIDLGFGSLKFYPGITSYEINRIHTVIKEMTIEEIEEKLGYKIKIVSNNKEG